MNFYIENQNGEKVYEGTQEACTNEIDRLINSEEGYWFLFDETDPDEAWQEGGLVEVKEKIDDHKYWDEHYRKMNLFDRQNAAQQLRAVDLRQRAPRKNKSVGGASH